MKKAISTDLTSANILQILELLTHTPEQAQHLSKALTSDQWTLPLGRGERSFAEVLAHLVHCEARSSEAIYLALLLEEPLLAGVHPERQWGKLLRYDLFSFPELLAYFKVRRAVLLRVLSSLTEEQWMRCVREEAKKRKETVYWRARALALHELEHVSELQSKLHAMSTFESGT